MNWPDLTLPPINLYNAPMTWKQFKDIVEETNVTDDSLLNFIDVDFNDHKKINITLNMAHEVCIFD